MKLQTTIKEIMFTLLFTVANRFEGGPRKAAHSLKANHSYFDKINTCAVIFFLAISSRVVFTWHFINRNQISFLSKWQEWNNNRNEITPAVTVDWLASRLQNNNKMMGAIHSTSWFCVVYSSYLCVVDVLVVMFTHMYIYIYILYMYMDIYVDIDIDIDI